MLDQSFTVVNFRKIFDYENRKGCYLEGRYFPEIEIITKKLKTCITEFKTLNKEKLVLSSKEYEEKKSKLNDKKEKFKEQKESLLKQELEKISERISKGDFCIKLVQVNTPIGKPAYSIEKSDVCTYFLIKQIQYSIKKLYKVQQSNRYNIICQLRSLLNDSFPKYIIRTDIKEFYESIPRDRLLNRINKDGLLTLTSKKFIKEILNEYGNISKSSIGIPRGIGISAYLAELYMSDFDEAIKKHPEIIFYARYVDDIIAIYTPKPNSDSSNLLNEFHKEAKKLALKINTRKTNKVDLTTKRIGRLEYLGYCFELTEKSIDIKISKNKEKRYKKRIKLTFDAYHKTKLNEKLSRKLFVKRLRFLTGNPRLSNNKDNTLVGIYFSNSLITNSSSLTELDKFLINQISKITSPCKGLKARLKTLTFIEGWSQKKFYKFSPRDLQEIVKVWKNGA